MSCYFPLQTLYLFVFSVKLYCNLMYHSILLCFAFVFNSVLQKNLYRSFWVRCHGDTHWGLVQSGSLGSALVLKKTVAISELNRCGDNTFIRVKIQLFNMWNTFHCYHVKLVCHPVLTEVSVHVITCFKCCNKVTSNVYVRKFVIMLFT